MSGEFWVSLKNKTVKEENIAKLIKSETVRKKKCVSNSRKEKAFFVAFFQLVKPTKFEPAWHVNCCDLWTARLKVFVPPLLRYTHDAFPLLAKLRAFFELKTLFRALYSTASYLRSLSDETRSTKRRRIPRVVTISASDFTIQGYAGQQFTSITNH